MKVMIVDDEVIIREGMRKVIPWREYGYELLETASSAEEAIERIKREQPEIVLTDIRMKGKSGLDLAAYIKAQAFPTEVIVLTGYGEFSYAQEALRQGVCDYLLKTSAPEEIMKSLQKAKERIEDSKEHRKWKLGSREREISNLMHQLLVEKLETSDYKKLFHLMPEMKKPPYQLLLLDEALNPGQLAEAEKLWNTYLPGKWVALHDKTVIIVQRDPQLADHYLLNMAIKKIPQSNCLPVFVGSIVTSVSEWHASYKELDGIVLYKWLLSTQRMVTSNDIQGRKGIPHSELLPAQEVQLLSYVKRGESEILKEWFRKRMYELFNHPQATPESIHLYVQTLYVSTIRFVNQIAASIGNTPHSYQSLPTPREWFPSPLELLFPLFLRIMNDYQELSSSTQVNYVQNVIHYMEQRLGDSLTLQKIANHVHLHPNYLGDLIKKETGKSYVELLTELRMKKAIILLTHSPAKVKDIAKIVGYSDWKYFITLFKKHTGVTPSQYRRNE
ncbi:response regulator transcription factor [Ferdinandcohnia quinoae]|uniref:Response regulator n=1 Tax=Fredinandcohnia quinoae TaxID=2918902 RepID=A0AAW5E8X4_9BACI|nr:response regulator [Fredinandcohnia sp. SECRCQ15]MCH1627695.1 response regulator [Fredinandcohnia sp. SECRCQ15]